MTDGSLPRGCRLANPGNIRHSKIVWRGEADVQPDPDFVAFKAPEWGLRAMAKILLTYEVAGFNTIRKIITRWAPAIENDTSAYVADVAKRVGVNPDAPVDLTNPGLMAKTLAAIVRHENGVQPYAADLIDKAVSLALPAHV